MFKIRPTDPEEDTDSETESHYFISDSILTTGKTECSQTSTKSTIVSTTAPLVPESIETNSCATSSAPNVDNRSTSEESSGDPVVNTSANRKPVVFGNTLLVNPNQSANKLLKHLRIPYQISAAISPAHYLPFDSCCVIFLSLKYHVIYQNYIYDKLNELRNAYQLKVLLVLVDHIQFQSALKELTQLAIRTQCTLMLCWSYEEAANYIENYRQFADKSSDIIMGKMNANSESSQTAYQCLVDALTSVKSINKTDAVSLITTFDTFENIVHSDDDQLIICPGMAALKAQRLRQLFQKPFIRTDQKL